MDSTTVRITGRLQGVDSLRFVFAMAVMLQHTTFVLPVLRVDISLPAVIAFFVVSGLCIHYSCRDLDTINLRQYYPRRYLRIGIPCLFALLLGWCLNYSYWPPNDSVLWTLICEEVYYTLYPLVHRVAKKSGWLPIVVVSYLIASMVVAVLYMQRAHLANFEFAWVQWIIGAPCWLLGCLLAERLRHPLTIPHSLKVWSLRIGFILISVLWLRFLGQHSFAKQVLGHPMALFVFWWLSSEIPYARKVPPLQVLENMGRFSYSLYLIHCPVANWVATILLPKLGLLNTVMLLSPLCVCASYVFYLVVESPAHKLARSWTGSKFATRQIPVLASD